MARRQSHVFAGRSRFPEYELFVCVVLACVFESVVQRSPQPGISTGLVEPEDSGKSRVNVTERPLMPSEIAESDDGFGLCGVVTRDDVVPCVPPPHRVALAHTPCAQYGSVPDERVDWNRFAGAN